MPKGTFIYSEARLAEHLGIPRNDLFAVRTMVLKKNEHWKLEKGKVALSLQGILALIRELGIASGRVDPTACYFEKNGEVRPSVLLLTDSGWTAPPVRMRVRAIFPNPRLLECTEVGRPLSLARVVVRSNLNFRIGMEFAAVPDPANPGFWVVEGGNTPRFPGRW